MRVLVTGGSGFLGNAIIKTIQEAHPDWIVHILDLQPPPTKRENVYFHKANITIPQEVQDVFAEVNPDAVIHTAGFVPSGQSRYSNDKKLRDRIFLVNHSGTVNNLKAAKQTHCRAFVYTSSCTVISDDMNHNYPAMTEEIPTGNATLAYGASKAPAEAAVLAANSPTMATCALRPATIFGPGDNLGVIGIMHSCIAKGETPFVIGDGNNLYDFAYISNIADAHLLALENLLSHSQTPDTPASSNGSTEAPAKGQSAAGHAFFVSNQEPVYFRDFMLAVWAQFGHVPAWQMRIPAALAWAAGGLAEAVSWWTGAEATLSRGSVNDAVGVRYSDNAKARRVLGYVPRVKLADAVRLACEDYKRILHERLQVKNKKEELIN